MMGVSFLRNMYKRRLHTIVLFITSRCNARCRGCFYWKSLNKDELSLKEMERIFKGIPKLETVLFSGGEPFLREDIVEIVRLLVKTNKVKTIGIPTNGFLTKTIVKNVRRILREFPKLNLGIYISMDGFEKTHDKLRGVKGISKKALKTIEELKKLKKQERNFNLTVNSVILNENYKELPRFVGFVKKLRVDNHTFDLLRGYHQQLVNLPPIKEIEKINRLRQKVRAYYTRKNPFLLRRYSVLREHFINKTQMDVLRNKKWCFDCLAGQIISVVYSNGDLALCELLPPIENLKKKGFKELWNSKKAKKQRLGMKKHVCDCTHICFLSASLDHSPSTILCKIPFGK